MPIVSATDYNTINAHPRDAFLSFDEASHTYTFEGRVLDSVTTVVEDCFERFDAEYWAERKATPWRTKEMIMAEWEEKGRAARDLGTLMHARIENYYLGNEPTEAERTDPTFTNFLRFAASRTLRPYRTEWRIYMEEYGLAGTLDFLELCDDGSFEIWDWKRSTKVVNPDGSAADGNNYGKRAHYPLCHLPDTVFHHYALQLSIYRYILHAKYGIPVRAGHLGVFHPDYPCPWVVDVPYLRSEVETLLNLRLPR